MKAPDSLKETIETLQTRAHLLRLQSIESTSAAGSGHPTSCLSAADIVSAVFFRFLQLDPNRPDAVGNDRFVLSKGHAAPVLYAALKQMGALEDVDLTSLRQTTSILEGHPVPRVPGVQVGTGSLGQGLAVGVGMARGIHLAGRSNRVFVLLGDGEMAEGSVWEALHLAPELGVTNLTAIVDMNRLGQSDPTMLGWEAESLFRRASAFGWHAPIVDGHSLPDLVDTIGLALDDERPSLVIAKTVKGKGVSFLEDAEGRHGKAIDGDELETARRELDAAIRETGIDASSLSTPRTITVPSPSSESSPPYALETDYELGEEVATRDAFGSALMKLGRKDDRIVALDGDVKNSTRSRDFFGSFPDRSIECFISEQTMTGIAQGLAVEGFRPVAATFAAFWTRAHDQLRMGGYSDSKVTLAGSHTGVAIGEDGPSQMGLEDLAMMRSIFGSTVLSPSDAVSAEKLTAAAVEADGSAYIRTIRGKTPVIYDNGEEFPVPGVKVLRSSTDDVAVIFATGVTVHEALEAADILADRGTPVAVVDCYSIKPIDEGAIRRAASAVGTVVTVEDHYISGGLGEIVGTIVPQAVQVLAVEKRPHSGASDELLAEQGIDAAGIVAAVASA